LSYFTFTSKIHLAAKIIKEKKKNLLEQLLNPRVLCMWLCLALAGKILSNLIFVFNS